jgi:hypothetical protein
VTLVLWNDTAGPSRKLYSQRPRLPLGRNAVYVESLIDDFTVTSTLDLTNPNDSEH